MPDKTPEERIAVLEAQVQGLAAHIAAEVHGWETYTLEWAAVDEMPSPGWVRVYDWKLDPRHPLYQEASADV